VGVKAVTLVSNFSSNVWQVAEIAEPSGQLSRCHGAAQTELADPPVVVHVGTIVRRQSVLVPSPLSLVKYMTRTVSGRLPW
jgi:hypothetical protein